MIGFLKISILTIILGICTRLGILKAKTYDNRVIELKRIKNALEVLKSKIEFTYEPIKDIFVEISKIVYANEQNIFSQTLINMEQNDITQSWNMAVEKNSNLEKEDKSTIKMFGKLLGKTDKAGQINEINVTSKLLDTLMEKAEEEKNKNYKLFKTLGCVIGIGICIILI